GIRDGHVTGVQTCALPILTGLVTNQAGAYSVIVSNAYGLVTNYAAVQNVFDLAPFFTLQPTNRTALPGSSATFQARADGSKPIRSEERRVGKAESTRWRRM